MRLDFATLCDTATEREGLLNILGAGVTVVHSAGFPTQLSMALAAMLSADRTELNEPHHIQVVLRASGAADLVIADGFLPGQLARPQFPDLPMYLPAVIPLNGVSIQEPGLVSILVQVDGQLAATLPLMVVALHVELTPESAVPVVGSVN